MLLSLLCSRASRLRPVTVSATTTVCLVATSLTLAAPAAQAGQAGQAGQATDAAPATRASRAGTVYGGAPVPPGGVALTWSPAYMSDEHSYSAADAQRLAQTYDLVAALPSALGAHSAEMRRTNPRINLLAYANATLESPSNTGSLPESAFAHTTDGSRITAPDFGTYLMESSSPAWRTAANAQCDTRAARGGFDGCLVDMLTLGIFSKGFVTGLPVNPATGAPYTQLAYRGQMTSLAAFYRSKSPQLAHVGNSVENSYRYWQSKEAVSRPLALSQPATQMEDFLRGASNSATKFPSAEDWVRNVDVVRDLSSHDTVGLFTTKLWSPASDAQVAQWQAYAMATFLMGADGSSYFSFSRSRNKAGVLGTNVPYSMPDGLGAPRGAMVSSTKGTWTREFANGRSVVNPTDSPVTVTLPAPARTLAGRTVTALRLPAHSGDVLITSPTSPATDTTRPVLSIGGPQRTRGALRVSGVLRDDRAARTVRVTVRDLRTGKWRRAGGTWGAHAVLPTSQRRTSAVAVRWSKALRLRPGRYRVTAFGTDGAGNRSRAQGRTVVVIARRR